MRPRQADGFTYLGLLILLTVIGLVGAATLKVNVLLERAEAEEQLLGIGAAFSDALQSYAAATPPGQPQQPPTLKELLRDARFPNPRRHLRKVFVDPVTGKAEWGIMYLAEKKGVIGVYSLSQDKPFKVANFDARFQGFQNKEHLSDWKFTMTGQGVVRLNGAPPLAPLGGAARAEAEAAKALAAKTDAANADPAKSEPASLFPNARELAPPGQPALPPPPAPRPPPDTPMPPPEPPQPPQPPEPTASPATPADGDKPAEPGDKTDAPDPKP
ncbi:MAG: type II secretion system protein, partial [Massilia sp.]